MSRIPIRVRLTSWFVVVLTAMLLALGSFVVARLRADLTAEVDRSLTATAARIRQGYRDEGLAEFTEGTTEAVTTPGSRTLGAQLLDARGAVVRFAGAELLGRPAVDPSTVGSARAEATVFRSVRVPPSRTHLRLISVPVTVGDGRGMLVVAEPLEEIDSAVRQAGLLLLVGGFGGLVPAALGAWVIAGRALRPVQRLTRRAAAIDVEGLDQRVPVPPARDELNHLARTFNAMLDRLQSGVAARERLIADASHELRAPLAAIRTELEVSLRHDDLAAPTRDVLESLREEAVRMGRIVEDLLTLARIDDGRLDLLRSPQDLLELVRGSVRSQAAPAAAAGVDLQVSGDGVLARCDRDRVVQVVANLLDNAIRVSPRGAAVQVHVDQVGDHARVRIRDHGPGVAPENRELIFERFARLDPARGRSGGAGLGLSIAREIVRAHHGALDLATVDGAGSMFTIMLPAQAQAQASAGTGH